MLRPARELPNEVERERLRKVDTSTHGGLPWVYGPEGLPKKLTVRRNVVTVCTTWLSY
jgi:hypothetical protein